MKSNVNEPGGGPGFYRTANSRSYGVIKEFVRMHRYPGTPAEDALWDRLKGKKLGGNKFRRQHIVGSYIADFINLSHNLIIEVDGLIHQLPKNKASDFERTKTLNEMGYKLIRFTNKEVLDDIERVLSKILDAIEDHLPKI